MQDPVVELLRGDRPSLLLRNRGSRAKQDENVTESIEMQWLVSNSRTLGKYRGEWLLFGGQILLVHSRDFDDIKRKIAEQALTSPFVYYVPTSEESNFLGI